jgi:hypothetical protein
MTLTDVATKCRVTNERAAIWIVAGIRGVKLRAATVGGLWRVSPDDLVAFLDELRAEGIPVEASPIVSRHDMPAERAKQVAAARRELAALGV